MKKIYIDNEYKCHATEKEGCRAIETDIFDNLCDKSIETMVYVPSGEMYKGVICTEGFIQCTDTALCEAYQREYERQLLAKYEAALAESVPLSDLTAAYQEGVNAAYDQE